MLTVLLSALFLLCVMQEEPADSIDLSISFRIGSGITEETIYPWKNPGGDYIVFLPGYAQMDQVWAVPQNQEVFMNGSKLSGKNTVR